MTIDDNLTKILEAAIVIIPSTMGAFLTFYIQFKSLPQTDTGPHKTKLRRINWALPLSVFAILLSVILSFRSQLPPNLYVATDVISTVKDGSSDFYYSDWFEIPDSFVGILNVVVEHGGPNQLIFAIGVVSNNCFENDGIHKSLGGSGNLGRAAVEVTSDGLKARITKIPKEFQEPLPQGQTRNIRIALIGTHSS